MARAAVPHDEVICEHEQRAGRLSRGKWSREGATSTEGLRQEQASVVVITGQSMEGDRA